jgi:hypothetical protein
MFAGSNWSRTVKIKVIVHEAEEGGFWAEVPAIPGCATEGDRRAAAQLHEAIEGADFTRLEGFLRRNGYPYQVLDAVNDADGRAIMERFGVLEEERRLMLCPNGTLLKRPNNEEAADPRSRPGQGL